MLRILLEQSAFYFYFSFPFFSIGASGERSPRIFFNPTNFPNALSRY